MKNIHLTEIKHSWENVKYTSVNDCAKFRGSRGAIMGLVGLVPSCHCAFLATSWIQNFFLVGISWVQNFLVGIRGSEIFSFRYFVGQNFFSREYFVNPIFSLSLISCFREFRLLAIWARVTKTEIPKFISNHGFFSKLISTIANCLY